MSEICPHAQRKLVGAVAVEKKKNEEEEEEEEHV